MGQPNILYLKNVMYLEEPMLYSCLKTEPKSNNASRPEFHLTGEVGLEE